MNDRRRKIGQALALAVGATLLAAGIQATGGLDRWENTSWDWRARLRADRAAAGSGPESARPDSAAICLILLDQHSLDWGQETMGLAWPWPREVYTPIIDFCMRGGARSLSFDVMFTEPSVMGVEDDQLLGETIAASGFFLGALFVHGDLSVAEKITRPIPEVADNVLTLGNVSDTPDDDGVFRRITLWVETAAGDTIFNLGAAVARQRGGGLDTRDGRQRILDYRRHQDSWRIFNAAEIIQSDLRLLEGAESRLDPAVMRDKHVFFGFSAPGLLDLRATPLDRVAPGVVIHATALENILQDRFIEAAPPALVVLAMLVLTWAGAWLLLQVGHLVRTLLVLVVFLALPVGLAVAAALDGVWWPMVPGLLAQILALGGAMILAWATEGRQKRFIRQAFRHYLSPEVISRIVEDPDRLKLGGERRELTIFFSDLEGFTTLSEGLEPQELTQLLNEYLTDMTDIILASGGTLDKYEGDAIIAFWNAPADQPDHALRACRASVQCQRKLTERRAEFRERFGSELHMRIGLNTGPVIVGNMGSNQRFDYTVLGDAANLAARLEGANKVFGTYLMISDSTRAAVGEAMLARELGALRVVGRKQPVRVYELAGFAGEAEPAHWAEYRAALDLCEQGRVAEAAAAMQALHEGPAADPAAGHWWERLQEETEGFDAVWNLTRK